MLIIACMNGAFGFRWMHRVKRRDYISDVVKRSLGIWRRDQVLAVRGSLMYLPSMRRFIEQHNSPENTLLMIGKSKGAYWMNELAKEMGSYLCYQKKRLILVDACWLGRHRRNIVPPTTFDMIYNFYQTNEIFLNGAWFAGSMGDNTGSLFVQQNLTKSGVDHWSIIHAPEVKQAIQESIKDLI